MVSVLLTQHVCGCSEASLCSFCSKQAPFKCQQQSYVSKLEQNKDLSVRILFCVFAERGIVFKDTDNCTCVPRPLTVTNIHAHVQAGFGEVTERLMESEDWLTSCHCWG